MAQDVNQSEKDVAALVRSALVARISPERYELWMPPADNWHWDGAALTIRFSNEFARQTARRLLHADLRNALTEVVGAHAALETEVAAIQVASTNVAEAIVQQSTSIQSTSIQSTSIIGRTGTEDAFALTVDRAVGRAAESTERDATLSLCKPVGDRAADEDDRLVVESGLDRSMQASIDPFAPLSGATESPLAQGVLKGNFSDRRNRKSTSLAKPAAAQSHSSIKSNASSIAASAGSARQEEIDDSKARRTGGDPWHEFVLGSSNRMAWTSMNMIAEDPGSMTPALVHGPYGVGKSHLGAALAQRLRAQKRQRRVVHISAEQFTNDFTEAIRGGGLPMMRRKYRDADTLILDDLHFLLGKKATIGELRQTLDYLLKAGRQVVFLADRSPSELEGLGNDFLARLRGGMVSPMLPLDEETRYQILRRDLIAAEIHLSEDIMSQIAARVIGDGRLLKGIVKRLRAATYVVERSLGWDDCWNAVYDLVQATQPIVRLGDIERVVCEVFGLEPNSLQSDRKTRQVSQPRMLAMFLARKYTPAAYQEIGEYFGKRRHSTVISAEKTVGTWLEENASLQISRGSLKIRDAMRHVESHLHVG